MGVSDRTAVNGLLYDGWGAEGMRVLNRTATLQAMATEREVSIYDAVLMVAARAKESAYQAVEDQPGYIGSSFGGPMGSGVHKPLPARSHVVGAIEDLLEEAAITGELPEVVTPGIPDELLEQWALEESEAEAAAAEAEAAAASTVGAASKHASARGEEEEDEEEEADKDEDDESHDDNTLDGATADDDIIDALLDDDDDFEDDVDVDFLDDDISDLFGDLSDGASDDNIEASGMSPGDSG